MGTELKQKVKLTQQLVMTPQLQQAIKLLKLSRTELVTLVNDELQENPVLEEFTDASVLDSERGSESSQGDDLGDDSSAMPGLEEPDIGADSPWQHSLEYIPQTRAPSSSGIFERSSSDSVVSLESTLVEHLTSQLHMLSLESPVRGAAEWIIGNLDENGYIVAALDEIASYSSTHVEDVHTALDVVQSLDPPGVGARDLRECLLIQLRSSDDYSGLALLLVEDHLDSLRSKDFHKLARDNGVDLREIDEAVKEIARLDPKPGLAFEISEPIYIVPDVYVHKFEDSYHIALNEDEMPRLRVSNIYRELMKAGESQAAEKTKHFVQDRFQSAVWLIKAMHQRRATIYRVMESVVKFQQDFLDHGTEYLQPLTLRDVAQDINMHESTVSRVTTNKYVQTPQGTFNLKYLFGSRLVGSGGRTFTNQSVKEMIRKIISSEDRTNPLSDQRIVETLQGVDILIARRTVTKYRRSMHISSAAVRRQVG